MTDKEKMLALLERFNDENGANFELNFESIVLSYIDIYKKDFPMTRITELMRDIGVILYYEADKFDRLKNVANERAFYLKTYLEGNMWKTEEDAKRNVQPQINNAQAIIDACNGKFHFNSNF